MCIRKLHILALTFFCLASLSFQPIFAMHNNLDHEYYYKKAVSYSIAKNSKEAIIHFKQAADLGNKDAAYSLGVIYHTGEFGGQKNPTEAILYYKKAVKLQDGMAAYVLGKFYFEGENNLGITKNLDKAIKYLNRAVKMEYKPANIRLKMAEKEKGTALWYPVCNYKKKFQLKNF
jgi:TPR repeat protein